MKLIIVESPTKAKTISRFLSDDFIVESSYGHIRDLPKSKTGIDIEKNFEPTYVIPTKSRKRVNELKKEATKADEVILASDEDREGEAIAWHLIQALGLNELKSQKSNLKIKRIVFHEITETAIKDALKNPRDIDVNLVNAQQARRILDRLVGYELSPFLWKKVFKGLSAGRVQSVAVRLIADREKEINEFKPEEFWSIIANLKNKELNFDAKLIKENDKTLEKFDIKNKEDADKIISELKNAEYETENIVKKETKRNPGAPFTTSTLQQEASSKLNYSAKQTMMFAQQLYENGYITYMRTDSVNLSAESIVAAKKTIEKIYGKEYSVDEPREFKTKSKGAQEAHEAIRPTKPEITPEILKPSLDAKQFKLYDLIWKRFIACQTKEAVFDSTTIDIKAKQYTFRATGSIMKFDGWLKIYPSVFTQNILPNLKEKDVLALIKLTPDQHFTEPPPRYNEATLVKALEEYGIGRPSTYAPTIATIQTRNYVEKNEQKRFIPTETGTLVNDLLVKHFPEIVDIEFTAKMEENLDEVAEGKKEWVPVIKDFYEPFHKNLENKYEEVEKQKTDEETKEICDKCGKPMIIKHGRFGRFIACSGFPECRNTKKIKQDMKTIGMKCPKCIDGEIIEKRTKKKRLFYGCSLYPTCDFASWTNPKNENASN